MKTTIKNVMLGFGFAFMAAGIVYVTNGIYSTSIGFFIAGLVLFGLSFFPLKRNKQENKKK